ncbi:MAG: hypothetical protein K0U41_00805 [Gammaproteobacteria bacterium]|nr:hypothetical protein [Gammaproteobacteria bacterium]
MELRLCVLPKSFAVTGAVGSVAGGGLGSVVGGGLGSVAGGGLGSAASGGLGSVAFFFRDLRKPNIIL